MIPAAASACDEVEFSWCKVISMYILEGQLSTPNERRRIENYMACLCCKRKRKRVKIKDLKYKWIEENIMWYATNNDPVSGENHKWKKVVDKQSEG